MSRKTNHPAAGKAGIATVSRLTAGDTFVAFEIAELDSMANSDIIGPASMTFTRMGTVILIFFVLIAGISFGFMLGFSRAMREAATRIHGMKPPVIAKIVIGLGCAVLVGALGTSLHTWHFTRVAQHTSGTVIEMRERTDKETGSISYAPTFRFGDARGAEHTVASGFFSSPPEFHVGDRVGVLYRADSPKSARIDSYWQVWGLPSLLGIIGSIELSVGFVMLFWPKITGRFRRDTPLAQAA